jgi:UDP-3-O-[3-hydroxymyristoyl] glucosamine N-acyltransferase
MTEKPDTSRPSFTLRELARMLDCPFEGDGNTIITGVAALNRAGQGDLVFWSGPKMKRALEECQGAAAIIPSEESFSRLPVIKSPHPKRTFVQATELFFSPYRPEPGIHATAVISPTARIGRNVAIGALSVVADEAEVGDDVVIFPLVSIYPRVKVGAGTVIHSQVCLREDVRIGSRVLLHSGVVIGSDGFAYLQNPDRTHHKIPQKGTVVIEDDVEIGANTTVDRAALGETVIRRGTKIDNLVMVAHNVEVGSDTLLISQTGIAGSSTVGNNVLVAGQVGISDHVHVGDRVIITAKSGVSKDIPAGTFGGGIPFMDIRDARKFWVTVPLLADLVKDFKKLKARVEELEKKLGEKDQGEKR